MVLYLTRLLAVSATPTRLTEGHQMTIAFTGATGNLAAHLVEELLERTSASRLVALARDPDKASAIASRGVEVRRFDYDEPGDLADALAGVERLLLISGRDRKSTR